MVSRRREILLYALKHFDLLIMAFSFLLASSAVSFQTGTISFVEFLSMRVKVQNFVLFIALLALWHFIFHRWCQACDFGNLDL